MTGKNLVYLDSCIFIAWLKNEIRSDPREMAGVSDIGVSFDMGQIDIVTSTITFTEVLQSSIGQSEFDRFRNLFSRRNAFLIDVNRKIAEISHNIRDFYYSPNSQALDTPDCIHLASAIWFHCSIFYTFDGSSGKSNGLLNLPFPLANKYPLKIQKPSSNSITQLPLLTQ